MRATLALVLTACACGNDAPEVAEPEADLRAEVRLLQRAMTRDLVLLSLEEVEEAMAEDLPVRAAELLESGAIPASRRQAERVAGLATHHPRAQALRDEAVELLGERTRALEAYQRALERGLVEDVTLLDALSSQREAEEAIDAFLGRLEAIAPLRNGKNQG